MAELDYSLVEVSKEGSGSMTGQIAELISKNIEMKILFPGERLPTERELAEQLNVARGTVKAAYRRLERQNVIRTRQGSGSYVIRDEELSQKLRRDKAAHLITRAIVSLEELGYSTAEMSRLFEARLAQQPGRTVRTAIICDSAELLLDFKRQLSYQQQVDISIFILESITENPDPERLLGSFDLIIIPTRLYHGFIELLPALAEKAVEAAVTPSSETLVSLTSLPRTARIGIICRTNVFLAAVKEVLLSYGFSENNISSFFEMDYTVETYFPGGIDALITFTDAHVFTNPAFGFRNEEFWGKGGKIIAFKHQLEQGTVIYIEDRARLLRKKREL